VKLLSGDSLGEPSAELPDIGTGSDLGKEILPDSLGLVDSGQPGFVIVILQNDAFAVQLNCPKGQRIELSRIERINRNAAFPTPDQVWPQVFFRNQMARRLEHSHLFPRVRPLRLVRGEENG
jgi:hypothetical protein